jgi:ABC-type branched-subunit amino acid transport system permease subunit
MGGGEAAVTRGAFAAWIGAIVAVVLVQSAVHLAVVLRSDRIDTLIDLDRSNGLPDIASTIALAAAAAAAISIARGERGRRSVAAAALGIALGALTLADVVHDGPHPASPVGWVVISGVLAAGALLAVLAGMGTLRTRITLSAATCLLVASFLVNGLDQYDQWFERERGDPVVEYQIVAKEGLELVGWALVALALWDEALRRLVPERTTVPRSRSRAA